MPEAFGGGGWPELNQLVQFSIQERLLRRNVKRFQGVLVSKVHELFVSLNSRLENNKEEDEMPPAPSIHISGL